MKTFNWHVLTRCCWYFNHTGELVVIFVSKYFWQSSTFQRILHRIIKMHLWLAVRLGLWGDTQADLPFSKAVGPCCSALLKNAQRCKICADNLSELPTHQVSLFPEKLASIPSIVPKQLPGRDRGRLLPVKLQFSQQPLCRPSKPWDTKLSSTLQAK